MKASQTIASSPASLNILIYCACCASSETYKTGGTRFACAVGADVLPVALNSGRYWPRNSIAKKPGTITVSFGPVIKTAGREPHEVNAEVANWIEDEIRRWDKPVD